jgi:hypothetical protein
VATQSRGTRRASCAQPSAENSSDALPCHSEYSSNNGASNDPEQGPSGFQQLVVDESVDEDDEDESELLQVVTDSMDHEVGPSSYRMFSSQSGFQPVGSASLDQEPGPSGYDSSSGSRAYRESAESVSKPDHGSLPDNEPGPSGLAQSRNSPQVDDSSAANQYLGAEPGPSNYAGPVSGNSRPDPILLGPVHGEISNPPSPLGDQVAIGRNFE